MGQGYMLECENGHRLDYHLGIGMLYPVVYEETINDINAGKYGEDLKDYFQQHPGAAINASRSLYVCTKCHHPHEALNLDLYCRKGDAKSEECWCYWCDDKGYDFIRSYDHRCPDCGTSMILLEDDTEKIEENDSIQTLCPECNAPMQFGFSGLMWD